MSTLVAPAAILSNTADMVMSIIRRLLHDRKVLFHFEQESNIQSFSKSMHSSKGVMAMDGMEGVDWGGGVLFRQQHNKINSNI